MQPALPQLWLWPHINKLYLQIRRGGGKEGEKGGEKGGGGEGKGERRRKGGVDVERRRKCGEKGGEKKGG